MQSRLHSLLEVKANLVSGFLLAWTINTFFLPWMYGIPVTATQGFVVTVTFTILSFFRQYIIRRLFNRFSS